MNPDLIQRICETIGISAFCLTICFVGWIAYRLFYKSLQDMHEENMESIKKR